MKSIKTKAVRMVLTVLAVVSIVISSVGFAVPSPAYASSTLRITYANWYTLSGIPHWYLTGKISWTYGQDLSATYERSWYSYTQHADNYGNYWGECVSTVKALSSSNVPTSQWSSGSNAISSSLTGGEAIATFFGAGGSYSGHCAFFKSYIYDGDAKIGFMVWDQNWYTESGSGVFGCHAIYCTGSSVTDADNYYVIMVP